MALPMSLLMGACGAPLSVEMMDCTIDVFSIEGGAIFQVEIAETGVLHLAFIYLCTNAPSKQGKSITARQRAINDRPLPNLASNLTPSMPVSHSPGLACDLTRLQLNPLLQPHCPASRSIKESIN